MQNTEKSATKLAADVILDMGRHKNKTLKRILHDEPDYFGWLLAHTTLGLLQQRHMNKEWLPVVCYLAEEIQNDFPKFDGQEYGDFSDPKTWQSMDRLLHCVWVNGNQPFLDMNRCKHFQSSPELIERFQQISEQKRKAEGFPEDDEEDVLSPKEREHFIDWFHPCTVLPSFVRAFGPGEALLLPILMDWEQGLSNRAEELSDGWLVYKDFRKVESQTGLSEQLQRQLLDSLLTQNLIERQGDNAGYSLRIRLLHKNIAERSQIR